MCSHMERVFGFQIEWIYLWYPISSKSASELDLHKDVCVQFFPQCKYFRCFCIVLLKNRIDRIIQNKHICITNRLSFIHCKYNCHPFCKNPGLPIYYERVFPSPLPLLLPLPLPLPLLWLLPCCCQSIRWSGVCMRRRLTHRLVVDTSPKLSCRGHLAKNPRQPLSYHVCSFCALQTPKCRHGQGQVECVQACQTKKNDPF